MRRKSRLLTAIEKSPAMSIDELANMYGCSYQVMFDHVKELAAAGSVNIRSEVRNGFKTSIIESIYHQRLRRLDEMYVFKMGLKLTNPH